jgi:hypothetical protein
MPAVSALLRLGKPSAFAGAHLGLLASLLRARLLSPSRLAPALGGLLPHTDALRSAPVEALAFWCWVAWSLYATAGLLVFFFSVPGTLELPRLGGGQLLALALLASLCIAVLAVVADAAAARVGAALWGARYPLLAAELQRRRAAAAVLEGVGMRSLFELVAARVRRGEGGALLLPPLPPRALLQALAASPPALPLALRSPAAAALRARRARSAAPSFAPPSLKQVAAGGFSSDGAGGGGSDRELQRQWEAECGHVQAPAWCVRLGWGEGAGERAEGFREWLAQGGEGGDVWACHRRDVCIQ